MFGAAERPPRTFPGGVFMCSVVVVRVGYDEYVPRSEADKRFIVEELMARPAADADKISEQGLVEIIEAATVAGVVVVVVPQRLRDAVTVTAL